MKKILLALVLSLVTTTASHAACGIASWYGRGKLTASGERFVPSGNTVAHRTLPFGTRLLITNTRNGRRVRARVNDRGPRYRSRIIDLSRGLAQRLGIRGLGRVCYQVIK